MKTLTRTLVVLALVASVPLLASWSGGDNGVQDQKKKSTPLGLQMKAVGKMQKQLRGIMKALAAEGEGSAEAFEQAIECARAAQLATWKAKNETPAQAASAPEDKRRAFIANYRRGMKNFLGSWIDLEIALYERDVAKATEIFKSLGKMKSKGHGAFKKKRDW